MLEVDTSGTQLDVRVNGDLEYALLEQLSSTLEAAEVGSYTKIVVDLIGCRFMSSTAMAKLITLSKTLPYALEIVVRQKTIVHRVLEVSGMLEPASPLTVAIVE